MIQNMRFWGTSAGEGTPTPFCECRLCENARKLGGREIRMRSCFRIDEKNAIDIGADFNAEALRMKESLYSLENIFYTHTHEDHFNYLAIWMRFAALKKLPKPINLYFVEDAYNVLDQFYFTSPLTEGREVYTKTSDVNFVRLEFGREYQIDRLRVTALRGDHRTGFEKNSANFLITLPDGRRMYYGLDSGYYLDETLGRLSGERLDLLISECTMPILTDDGVNSHGHMNLHTALRLFDRLYAIKAIHEGTQIWLTHIAPIGASHAELCEYLSKLNRPYRVNVAYDGLSLQNDFNF